MDCIDECGIATGTSRTADSPAGISSGSPTGSGFPACNSLSASQYMKENEHVYVMDIVHKGNVRLHRHDFYEFIFIERGFAIHNTRGGMSVLLPGDVILIAPDEPHSYFNVHAQKLYNCLFKVSALEGFESLLPLPVDDFLRALGIKVHIGMESREEMYRLLTSLADETRETRAGRNAKLKAQMAEVLLLAWRCHARRDTAIPSLVPHEPTGVTTGTYGYMSTGIVMLAIEYMQQEYANGINMQDVSSECGVTADYLAKLFRKACGIAPSEFLTSLRISSAMDLLQKTGRPVSDIALQVGYEDAAYFSRIFKKTVGASPLQYRSGPAAVR
jgi:AraC family L-rhamnose operon regulatory protein RhaS